MLITSVKAASVTFSVFPLLPCLHVVLHLLFLALSQGFVWSTDILELVPASATLLVVGSSCLYALLSAPVIALNKEAATSNMAIRVKGRRIKGLFCYFCFHKFCLSSTTKADFLESFTFDQSLIPDCKYLIFGYIHSVTI